MVVRHFRVSPCLLFDQLHINSSGFGSPTAIIYKEESAKEEDKIQCLFGLMLQLLPEYMRFKYIYLDAPYDLVKHDQLVQQIMDCRQLWSTLQKR
uniref:Uncharacterized protein n=1 Tax=Ditylenchus dipsaci TaxID=166011 RepID=A0A915DTH2_9BILA